MASLVRSHRPGGADLVRPDPLKELDRLNRRLARYLDSWPRHGALLDGVFTPPADVEETSDAYLIEIELPGVKRDDIDIEIAGRRVTIHGERHEKQRVGILRRRERIVGQFHYEVTLPGEVNEDAVEAHLDAGVLTVRVAKSESERPRRIEIH